MGLGSRSRVQKGLLWRVLSRVLALGCGGASCFLAESYSYLQRGLGSREQDLVSLYLIKTMKTWRAMVDHLQLGV